MKWVSRVFPLLSLIWNIAKNTILWPTFEQKQKRKKTQTFPLIPLQKASDLSRNNNGAIQWGVTFSLCWGKCGIIDLVAKPLLHRFDHQGLCHYAHSPLVPLHPPSTSLNIHTLQSLQKRQSVCCQTRRVVKWPFNHSSRDGKGRSFFLIEDWKNVWPDFVARQQGPAMTVCQQWEENEK